MERNKDVLRREEIKIHSDGNDTISATELANILFSMEAISQKLTNKMFLDSKSMVFFDSIEKGSIILNLYAEYYINMDKLSNYESCSIFSSLKNMLLIKKHLLGKSPKYVI